MNAQLQCIHVAILFLIYFRCLQLHSCSPRLVCTYPCFACTVHVKPEGEDLTCGDVVVMWYCVCTFVIQYYFKLYKHRLQICMYQLTVFLYLCLSFLSWLWYTCVELAHGHVGVNILRCLVMEGSVHTVYIVFVSVCRLYNCAHKVDVL